MNKSWLIVPIAVVTLFSGLALQGQDIPFGKPYEKLVESCDEPWQEPLPPGVEGLRLDHLRLEGRHQILRPGRYINDFLVDGEQIVFLVNSLPEEHDGRYPLWTRMYSQIYRTSFPSSAAAGTFNRSNETSPISRWSRPETQLLASFTSPTAVSLIKFVDGKLFFSIDEFDRELYRYIDPVPEVVDNALSQGGIYVVDDDGVRSITLPPPFNDVYVDNRIPEGRHTRWMRFPNNDQQLVNYYQHFGAPPNEKVWQITDARVFIFPGPEGVFLTRNRMTSEGHRMLDIVEMDIQSEHVGDVVSIRTDDKRRPKQTGHPVVVERSNIVFNEFTSKEQTRTFHFRGNGETGVSTLLLGGQWLFDAKKEFLYFTADEPFPEYLHPDSFKFRKIRVADNTVVGEIEIPNEDFFPETFEVIELASGRTAHRPIPGKFQHYQQVLFGEHLYFISKSSRAEDGGNVIVKVALDDPTDRKKIAFAWSLPRPRAELIGPSAGIRVSDQFVYYYDLEWIVRVSHTHNSGSQWSRHGQPDSITPIRDHERR